MFKKYIAFFSVLMLFETLSSQTYKPFDIKNKQWDVLLCTNVDWSTQPHHVKYDNVTYNICSDSVIINGLQYKPIYYKTHTFNNFSPPIDTTTPYSLYGYLRQDSILKRSYLRLQSWTNDSLLMDYNLSVGDTIKGGFYFYSKPNDPQCNTSWDIKEIKIKNIGNGNMAKCFYTDTLANGAYFIEGAGHSFGVFRNQGFYETYCEPFERCSNLLSLSNSSNCLSLVNSISKSELSKSFLKIFPNPVNQTLFTITSDLQFNYYKIVNITGRVIESKSFSYTTIVEINSSSLEPGYYFISTCLNGNSESILKVIVLK